MAGSGYVKLAIAGAYTGQQIRNILFYAKSGGLPETTISDTDMANVAGAWLSNFQEDYLGGLPTPYAMAGVEATTVDEHGVTTSEYPIFIAATASGDLTAGTDSPGPCAILSFFTSGVGAIGARALKRSYLAFGPAVTAWLGDSGAINAGGLTVLESVRPAFTNGFFVGAVTWQPVRIGRTSPLAQPAVGTLISSVWRPYMSFRKSRMQRPTGG